MPWWMKVTSLEHLTITLAVDRTVELNYLLMIIAAVLAAGLVWALFSVRQASSKLVELHRQCDHLEYRLQEFDGLQKRYAEQQQSLDTVKAQNSNLQADKARLEERIEAQADVHAEKLALLNNARQQLSEEFKNLANSIFEEKTERFDKKSKLTLDGALNPLKTQLSDFKKKVEDVYDKESKERVSLLHELAHLKTLNQKMSEDALNLTKALKGDKKTQGNWGEVILERVLEDSGLRKGKEYETQLSFKGEGGKRFMPDVVVRLPDDKDIVIDSKVSLVDYERYSSSEDALERDQALKAHVQAIKQHIESLSIKGYEGLEGLRTLDFVLIFIPIESAFMAAFDADPSMFKLAYDKQIIVVSPTTLLATLRTVQSIWRYEQQNRNAEKIAKQAGAIHDQFVL